MAYRNKYNLESLHIRAVLRTGVVADKYFPLDGLLLYQAHRMAAGGGPEATVPGDYTVQRVQTLPLGVTHPGQKNWYYQCSWAQWSHEIEGRDHWNKRFDSAFADLVDFDERRGKVNNAAGQYKAYHMPVFYRVAQFVDWYCVGDLAEIKALLSTVTHIGKKPVQGWGRVSEWLVSRYPEDWSTWRDGRLMRGIPAEDVADSGKPFNIGHYGIRPSYWKQSNQKMLALP